MSRQDRVLLSFSKAPKSISRDCQALEAVPSVISSGDLDIAIKGCQPHTSRASKILTLYE